MAQKNVPVTVTNLIVVGLMASAFILLAKLALRRWPVAGLSQVTESL